MGQDSESKKIENEYNARYFEELNRRMNQEYEEKKRMIKEQAAQQRLQNQRKNEYIRRQLENEQKATQNQLDKQRIDFILEYQGVAGYNLNPYQMPSSQLEYWSHQIMEKINNDNKKKRNELMRNME